MHSIDIKSIRAMVETLGEFEKNIAIADRVRSKILADSRGGDPVALQRLQEQIDGWSDALDAFRTLERAMKNSAASVTRFAQKTAKDEKLLADLKRGNGGGDDADVRPLLAAQRQALERVSQKLGFFESEIAKLRDALHFKAHKIKGMAELDKLQRALERDLQHLSESDIGHMIKRLDNMAKTHPRNA